MVTRGHCYHHSALRIPSEVVQVRLAPLLPRNFAEELKDASFHTKVLDVSVNELDVAIKARIVKFC